MYKRRKITYRLPRVMPRPQSNRGKKKKTTPSVETKLTSEQELEAIDAEMREIEKNIGDNAREYQDVRATMLSGMVTYAGTVIKEKIDSLVARLDGLKTQRTAVINKAQDVIFEQANTAINQCKEDSNENDKRLKNRERGYCENGCKPHDLVFDRNGSVDICRVCGAIYDHRLDASEEHLNYGDKDMYVPKRRGGGYKPPNHFAEIIAQFQGKRRSSAPLDVVEMIGRCCSRYGIQKHAITPKVVRMFLKQKQQEDVSARKYSTKSEKKKVGGGIVHKYTDYYKHCPEIAWRLSGIPPPYMMPSQEDRVVALFPMVVEAYRTSPRYLTRKSNRTNRIKENPNMLNYLYTMYKICELLGYVEFLPYIPLPKSLSNIEDCDVNGWKHVCKTYGWTYMQTSRCY